MSSVEPILGSIAFGIARQSPSRLSHAMWGLAIRKFRL